MHDKNLAFLVQGTLLSTDLNDDSTRPAMKIEIIKKR